MKVERKKGLKGIKVTHNKGVFWTAVVLFILLIAVVVSIKTIGNNGNGGLECVSDEDCVIAQTTACPCSMGGSDACVSKLEASDYNFSQQTSPEKGEIACAAVFNCKIKSCSCFEGKCAGEIAEGAE